MELFFAKPDKSLLKALAFCGLFVLCAKRSTSQVCASPGSTIYGLASNGNIVPVTISNASVGTAMNATAYAGSGGASANALGLNTVNGRFYYFQNNSSGSQQFLSFDPSTNTYTALATSPITNTVNRGCVSFNGTGYYCLDQNANLCYYNILTNTWSLITNNFTDQYGNNLATTFTSEGSGDMAIDGLGNLWIVSSNSSQWGLYKISAPLPTAGTASISITQLIAPTRATPSGSNFAGIAFNPTGEIYMSTNNDLYILQTGYVLSHIGSFSVSGVGSDLTSCNYPFGILPVSWQNFSAALQANKSVSLLWQVSAQINNKGYYIERSMDGSNWDEMGFVADAGTFKTSEQYSFMDNKPNIGKNYYRIRQVDLDGTSSYSEIKTVTLENSSNSSLSVWPNPAKDVVTIQNNNANGVAQVYNLSGMKLSESRLHSGMNVINIGSLQFGAYIVNIRSSDGTTYSYKLIKE
jgi:type IX secretion system substrate protein